MALLSDGKRSRAIAKSGAMMWRSCTSPGVTTILISRPIVSTAAWRFLPLIFLPASYPTESIFAPPFSALFTLEWPKGEKEPTKYWLSTLPEDISFHRLVDHAKLRWQIEHDYRELMGSATSKDE